MRTATSVVGAVTAATLAVIGMLPAASGAPIRSRGPAPVRPAPPSSYPLPAHALVVRTAAQLEAALRRTTPTDIVLADGVYASSAPFVDTHGHRLYARHLGRALLRAGLSIGSDHAASGAVVQGLAFDVANVDATAEGAAITVWGAANGARVADVTLRGNGIVEAGLRVQQPEGFRAERVVVRRFTDYGVTVDANDQSLQRLAQPFVLRDLDIAHVSRAAPGSSNGTGEACLWLGNTGVVQRARLRACAWTGLWTGTAATGLAVDGVDIDRTPVGVYLEHFTQRSTFSRLLVGRATRAGIVAEWDDPAWGGRPGSIDNTIERSQLRSSIVGVYLDSGTTRTTIRNCRFAYQRVAAIGDYRGIGNAYYGNDYSRIQPGAARVTTDHINVGGAG